MDATTIREACASVPPWPHHVSVDAVHLVVATALVVVVVDLFLLALLLLLAAAAAAVVVGIAVVIVITTRIARSLSGSGTDIMV